MSALERFAEPMNRVAGERGDEERQQQESPADPGGDRKADDHFERFEQGLAEQALHAVADRVEVGRAAIHEVAAAGFGEVGHVESQHFGVELHAQVVADLAAEPGDGDAVPDSENSFHQRADDDENANGQQRAEWRGGSQR